MSGILYPVAEKFVSINGEGTRAGELAVFIRFRGCNLNCSYCDTKWANGENCPAEMIGLDELADYIASTGVSNVTLTGGEPLLQKDLYPLIERVMSGRVRVEIETNGSVPFGELAEKPFRPSFTMDYKLPSSGMERFMDTDNFALLNESDTVKFVAGSVGDLEKAAEIIENYSLIGRCNVYFSPAFGQIEPSEIVEFMKSNSLNGVRLQLQLHKFIWSPDKRGV